MTAEIPVSYTAYIAVLRERDELKAERDRLLEQLDKANSVLQAALTQDTDE